ncbi:MAG: SigE family RNA polymerase sigma factor [Propionibacteriales bacterium]|nr:SigE family RNA polymerase sigma factor [Propionibacteriales bacterium]
MGDWVNGTEREAFDAFVRARYHDLVRFGTALTGNPQAGADLVQDALERTLMGWNRLQTPDNPEPYVRRAMVNRNISIWRRLRRERLTDVLPDKGYVDQPRDASMWATLQELPPRQRAVIALRYYEDLSEADIAAALGCSVGTVKSQASKGLAKLRALVPAEAHLEGC